MTADPMPRRMTGPTAGPASALTAARTGAQTAKRPDDPAAIPLRDQPPEPLPGPQGSHRPADARPGRGPADIAANRPPQTVRIENDGLIIEFCDDVPPDRLRGRAVDPAATAGQRWLHLRIRSDGLLAHAILQVANPALLRFVRSLDDLIRIGNGETSLTGTSRYPSVLRLDAEAGQARMTLLACPLLPTPVRVVVEDLELGDADLHAIRRWAAAHRMD